MANILVLPQGLNLLLLDLLMMILVSSAGFRFTSEIFQWFMDPDGDPETDDAPDVINNSGIVLLGFGNRVHSYAILIFRMLYKHFGLQGLFVFLLLEIMVPYLLLGQVPLTIRKRLLLEQLPF